VLAEEHRIYPQAVRWFLEGRLRVAGGTVTVDAARAPQGALTSPAP
jgi:phosphoribosylglycinamide formyltransferase-1